MKSSTYLTRNIVFTLPSFSAITVSGMNASAEGTLEEIAKAQNTYHDKYERYANNYRDLDYIGWHHGIKVQIHEATRDFWMATAGYKRGPYEYVFTYDHCGGGLQENKP
jgi:hypothetical protein